MNEFCLQAFETWNSSLIFYSKGVEFSSGEYNSDCNRKMGLNLGTERMAVEFKPNHFMFPNFSYLKNGDNNF